ncbi:AAA family ATPase [Streptomyces anulatus]|uniref:AAA family ATPase n=1 Tax=Streptomyces anulatus TaxID=1892 RepID=UPI002E122FE5|nr:AAA family ATPase [Streptomyces anulatus]
MVDGEDIWRCSAPECGRRTYGTCDPDDDQELPSYTETGADGTVLVYHGTGHLDLEATAELASQDGPGEDDEEPTGPLGAPFDLEPGTLVVAVGPPASGKSTAVARWFPATWRVSLDAYRGWLTDSEADQGASEEALAIRALVLEGRLRRGLTTVCDSTSITPAARADLLARAGAFNRPAVAILFDTPLEVCEARNAARERTVRIDVLREMHSQLPDAEQLLGEGFTAVHHIVPAPTGATMSKDTIGPERIADAVAVLRKAQEGDEEARVGLAEFFPEYEGLVMETDHARYLEAAANAGMVATHLLIIECGEWTASVDTYTAGFGLPLASVAVGDYYTSRSEAIREAVRAATDNGWTLAPESDWTDFDCGGGEIHIPIHVRPAHDQAQASPADVLPAEVSNRAHEMNSLPEVRFAVITDPDRRHAFFMATIAGDLDRLLGAYASERGLTVTPFEFTDPDIVFETQRWVSGTQQETGRSPMLLVGSVENGQWVNWNLGAVPRPPVPAY